MNPKYREENIKLLNDILKKRKSIRDLLPSKYSILVSGVCGETKFYKNDKGINKEKYAEYIHSCKKPILFNVKIKREH
jgi:hypothetical protein